MYWCNETLKSGMMMMTERTSVSTTLEFDDGTEKDDATKIVVVDFFDFVFKHNLG